jgi:threonine/homoserine/homoserine lactone efflux protein
MRYCRRLPFEETVMLDLQTLLLFTGAVMLLLISPGPSMAFVLSHGFSCGWRGGMAAACAIAVADLILTVLTATGVTGLVAAWPPSFDIIRYSGALYLLWMAWKALGSRSPGQATAGEPLALTTVFTRALFNSLLNPKALLFFLVFLPQFVVPEKGHIAEQIMLLGAVLTLLAWMFHALLGAFSGVFQRLLSGDGRFSRLQPRVLASVLALLALRLAVMSRPA